MKLGIFDVFRSSDGGISENPEGASVYAKITVAFSKASLAANAKLYLYYSSKAFNADDEILMDISSAFGITSVSSAGRTRTISLGVFEDTKDWYFTLRCESYPLFLEREDVLPRTSVPLFIDKNNYGVSIGQYSTANEDYHKFESAWPAYFHGGIADLGKQWEELDLASDSITTPGTYGGGILRACKVENKCIIQGSVMVTPGSSVMKIAELPSTDYWPGSEQGAIFAMNACQGNRIARIAVHGSEDTYPGYLCLEWVWSLSGNKQETSSKIWVQCSIEYWVD